MAITDYETLKTAVSNICARKDTKFLAQFDDWLSSAENMIYNGYGDIPSLKLQNMTAAATIPPVGDKYPLPDDYMSVLRIENDNNQSLSWAPPQEFYSSVSGSAIYYTVIGNDILILPSSSADIVLTYWKKYPALNDDASTNELLTKHSSVYLQAVLIGAYAFMRDAEEETKSTSRYQGIILALNKANQTKRHSGNARRVRFSGGCNSNFGQ